MQLRSTNCALICMESGSSTSYKSENMGQGEKRSAVLHWALHTIDPITIGAEQYAKKVVKVLHCKTFDREVIRNNLKSMTSRKKAGIRKLQ